MSETEQGKYTGSPAPTEPPPVYPPGGRREITADRLLDFLDKWAHKLAPEPEPTEPTPPSEQGGRSVLLILLKILPVLCAIGFFVSMFWDLSGAIHVPWDSTPIPLDGLIRMMTVTALIGFGTNWLAIKMLFYPRQKRPLLGQGLIPSRKDKIVTRLGEQISREIINSELILEQIRKSGLIAKHREKLIGSLRNVVRNQEFQEDLSELGRHYINTFLRSPEFQSRIKDFVRGIDFENVGVLEGGILRVYKMLTGDKEISERLQEILQNLSFRVDRYEDQLRDYLHGLPEQLEEQSDSIEEFALNAVVFLVEQVNVQNVIVDNLQRFDEVRLEKLLWRSTSDQLQYIQYLGCLLGLVGGFFIWRPAEFITRPVSSTKTTAR